MAWSRINGDSTPDSRELSSALNNFYQARLTIIRHRDRMNQMSNQQIADAYAVYASTSGGSDQATQAGVLKAEIAGDIGHFESNASQTGTLDACNQLSSNISR